MQHESDKKNTFNKIPIWPFSAEFSNEKNWLLNVAVS
jgi:hypothetical protein